MDQLVGPLEMGPDVNHADMFQPWIIDQTYTRFLNITKRELYKWAWDPWATYTIGGVPLIGSSHPVHCRFWRMKACNSAFTGREFASITAEVVYA